MDAIDCLKTRRSIREYRAEPIQTEILREIVDCARLASSGRNEQPWEFIVTTQKLKEISELAPNGSFIANAAACIAVVCKDTAYYLEDGSAATQNILLAARAYNIGSCWVAGDKKDYASEVLNLLGVPEGYNLVSLISLGYCDDFPLPYNKRKIDDVYHEETF